MTKFNKLKPGDLIRYGPDLCPRLWRVESVEPSPVYVNLATVKLVDPEGRGWIRLYINPYESVERVSSAHGASPERTN